VGATPPFRIERLAAHDRKAFSSGEAAIDRWFVGLSSQQVRRGLTAAQVLVDTANGAIAGFYALSNYTVRAELLADLGLRNLPQQMLIPAHLIGKLGVDRAYQGRGLGKLLVYHALRVAEAQTANAGSVCVVVDTLTPALVPWYQRLGFTPIAGHPLHLAITMTAIRRLP
jgi:GNAT superfamily N-acetyltransferase